ncbi:MAG: hypothetical protein A3I24_01345 [Candidatus Harrisonbacteria bacterium RIFCSPLOWO2_02_FULL_41_13b]|uniref:Uncharacterized protein n=1 Tax=Candidatus Harrisonbacteria bacterium RIFCSPLOWO2_02_FULL_41_13b TaxID=1798409 RepID=A0A1G1ZTK1_9BACT|nr:MAG: hypothetical protein A3J53_02275 [Candidatus Harrisonbacteria bacterium RIFCSPHIGHO2_02_FULL_40_20]OGY67805.1 MAG: hypothetical protein A3I24_01345 [Candidatus Harrisonbacteria bacterium RIFCSPLOWO2_02_FULL_41_13b]
MAKKNGPQIKRNVQPTIYFKNPIFRVPGGFTPMGAIFPSYIIVRADQVENVLELVFCDMQIGNDLVWFYFKDGLKIVVARDLIKKIDGI